MSGVWGSIASEGMSSTGGGLLLLVGWVSLLGRGKGCVFGMLIGLGWVLFMFYTLECLGRCPIRSPQSMTVLFGGVGVFLGRCPSGGVCVNLRSPSIGSCSIFFLTRFLVGKKTCGFGNLHLLERFR